jgi:hypothetical protein
MGRGIRTEKQFSENLDRLLRGKDLKITAQADRELVSALEFAGLMKNLRPVPSAEFKTALQQRLSAGLKAGESEADRNWFQKLFLNRPVWQTVSLVLILVIVGGTVLGLVLRSGGLQWGSLSPGDNTPPVHTPTLSATTAAPTATTGTTTTATTAVVPDFYLSAEAAVDKAAYSAGEEVLITITLRNEGSQPLEFKKYPPIVSLMSDSGSPVLTFQAGQSSLKLAAGAAAVFTRTWDQIDAKGRSVSPGSYYIELEDVEIPGQSLKVNLTGPHSFAILPSTD